jgi:hypothetical protein
MNFLKSGESMGLVKLESFSKDQKFFKKVVELDLAGPAPQRVVLSQLAFNHRSAKVSKSGDSEKEFAFSERDQWRLQSWLCATT